MVVMPYFKYSSVARPMAAMSSACLSTFPTLRGTTARTKRWALLIKYPLGSPSSRKQMVPVSGWAQPFVIPAASNAKLLATAPANKRLK